ncbi:MAG: HutP family protein [Bacillota bacterium]|jgi:hypothetical protein
MEYKNQKVLDSKRVASASLKMTLTETREEEDALKHKLRSEGIMAAAVNYGGDAVSSVSKIVERAVVAAKREGIINETHTEEGAVAGAAHEALQQIMSKAIGLSIGGKIGIAKYHDHISVAMVMSIGMLHLNEIAVGMSHRAIG